MHKDDEAFDFLTIRRYVRAEVKDLIPGIEHELLRLFHTRGGGRREAEIQKQNRKKAP